MLLLRLFRDMHGSQEARLLITYWEIEHVHKVCGTAVCSGEIEYGLV